MEESIIEKFNLPNSLNSKEQLNMEFIICIVSLSALNLGVLICLLLKVKR